MFPHALHPITSGLKPHGGSQGRGRDPAHLKFTLSGSICTSPHVRQPVPCCLSKRDYTDLALGFTDLPLGSPLAMCITPKELTRLGMIILVVFTSWCGHPMPQPVLRVPHSLLLSPHPLHSPLPGAIPTPGWEHPAPAMSCPITESMGSPPSAPATTAELQRDPNLGLGETWTFIGQHWAWQSLMRNS